MLNSVKSPLEVSNGVKKAVLVLFLSSLVSVHIFQAVPADLTVCRGFSYCWSLGNHCDMSCVSTD